MLRKQVSLEIPTVICSCIYESRFILFVVNYITVAKILVDPSPVNCGGVERELR